MKYLIPFALISTVLFLFLFMFHDTIVHKSVWTLEVPLHMIMVLLAVFIVGVLVLQLVQLNKPTERPKKLAHFIIAYLFLFSVLMIINPFDFPAKSSVKYQGFWSGSTSSGHIIIYEDKVFEKPAEVTEENLQIIKEKLPSMILKLREALTKAQS